MTPSESPDNSWLSLTRWFVGVCHVRRLLGTIDAVVRLTPRCARRRAHPPLETEDSLRAAATSTDRNSSRVKLLAVGQTSADFRLQKLMEVSDTSSAAPSWRRQRNPACGFLELASRSRPMWACHVSLPECVGRKRRTRFGNSVFVTSVGQTEGMKGAENSRRTHRPTRAI